MNPISPSIARHLCCVRLSPRPSGHKARFQRCVLLNSSCLIVNLNRCPQPVVSVAAVPLDSSLLCDPKRHTRPSSNYAAARSSSIRAVPSEPRVSSPRRRIFRLPALSRWSAHGVPSALVPTRLGYGDVSLVPLRVLKRSLSTLWHPRTRGFTTFATSAAIATAPRALDTLLVNA